MVCQRGHKTCEDSVRVRGALLTAALVIAPNHRALAQDDAVLEEITVTGSRIPRQDFTANAPVPTVDEAMFDETGSIGVETVLNQLPQFVPAVTQFASFDVENTATNTVGASTVSLRGLGPNRNLVLIDGRRAMPVNPTMVVDTNSIPAAAIARVEIISGGASAVYGADAVGGVVNFILKDDFEGANVDLRYGDTQHGGNEEVTISGLIGVNMENGPRQRHDRHRAGKPGGSNSSGNVTGASKTPRTPPPAAPGVSDRDVVRQSDGDVAAEQPFLQSTVDQIFSGRAPGTTVPANTRFYVNRTLTGRAPSSRA